MSVSIPRDYARLVEYVGDPMEDRAGLASAYTYRSKLKSLNVIVHFPDMTPVTRENYNSYRKRDLYDSDWMEFTVAAGAEARRRGATAAQWMQGYSKACRPSWRGPGVVKLATISLDCYNCESP